MAVSKGKPRFEKLLTQDTNITINSLTRLYIPGTALLIWLTIYALGPIYSGLFLQFKIDQRIHYTALLISMAISGVAAGWLLDKKLQAQALLHQSLLLSGLTALLTPLIKTSSAVMPHAILVGISGGAGLTALKFHLSESTTIHERGRIAGGLILISILTGAAIEQALKTSPIEISSIALGLIALTGLTAKTTGPMAVKEKKKAVTYIQSLKPYILTLILFTIGYSVYNTLITPHPIQLNQGLNKPLTGIIAIIGYTSAAIIGGVAADWIGRRTVIAFGLLSLSGAYLLYTFTPFLSPFALLMETGAWGGLTVILLYVIWGDISRSNKGFYYGASQGIFYLGIILAGLLPGSLGPIAHETISTFSAGVLMLGLLAIYYANEALPKDKIRVREIKSYVEEIKKMKV